jgi:hypothetical protein
MVAFSPLKASEELAKAELSRSIPKIDRVPWVENVGLSGAVNAAWKDLLV